MRIDTSDRIVQRLAKETRNANSSQETSSSLFNTHKENDLSNHNQSTLTATFLRAPDLNLATKFVHTHFH